MSAIWHWLLDGLRSLVPPALGFLLGRLDRWQPKRKRQPSAFAVGEQGPELVKVGICGNRSPEVLGTFEVCDLPAGHRGWHEGASEITGGVMVSPARWSGEQRQEDGSDL